MKVMHFSVFALLLLMVGYFQPAQCSTVEHTIQHQYELLVVDVDDNPLEGIKIEYTLKDREDIIESSAFITSSDGLFIKAFNATNPYKYLNNYKSEFNFKAIKDGYYSKSGTMSSNYGEKYSKAIEKYKITLIRPIDYFDKKFALTLSDVKLKMKILSFIDLIILQGLLAESVLEAQSVNLVPFKDNNYLQFKFTSVNVYNSIKLDKYNIGKRLFDEVVRKVLTPINEHVAESNLFYGYDITVVGHTKSFAEKHATINPIEYRFMIPEKIVRQYKNKDISGQQVLDGSVILMDDERIELKLQ